jgi:hypothetical protein
VAEVNMLPCHRGNLPEQIQKFLLLGGLAPVQQNGEQDGVVGGSEEPDEEFVLLAVNRRIVFLTVCLSPGASPLTITSCAANQQPGHDHQGPPGWLWDA